MDANIWGTAGRACQDVAGPKEFSKGQLSLLALNGSDLETPDFYYSLGISCVSVPKENCLL